MSVCHEMYKSILKKKNQYTKSDYETWLTCIMGTHDIGDSLTGVPKYISAGCCSQVSFHISARMPDKPTFTFPSLHNRVCHSGNVTQMELYLKVAFLSKTLIPGGIRTRDLWIRSPARYPLRYGDLR